MKKIVSKIAYGVISGAILAGMIVGDMLYSNFEESIVAVLCPPSVDKKASSTTTASGIELAEKMQGEGSVLVKNNNNILPLDKTASQVNVLGFGAYQWIFGGSGSGQVQPQELNGGNSKQIGILDALSEYGIAYNQDIINFYVSYAPRNSLINTLGFNVDTDPWQFGLKDPDLNSNVAYKSILDASKAYSDTALVVISRQGGESEDMPSSVQYKSKPSQTVDNNRHQLQISTEEEALLRYAGENFANTIVIVNSTNTFQLDFLDTIPGLDACLVVGATGNEGARAIPKILFGDINPSGRLADIQPYDFKKNIAFNYNGFDGVSFYNETNLPYGNNQSNNAGVSPRPSLPYVDYIEGIYVGYRYYETADQEGTFVSEKRTILDENGANKEVTGYDAVVQYPFGYGLSYSNFEYEVVSTSLASGSELTADSKIEIQVKVTNKGSSKGKDVVELYMTPQYNPGEVEKAHVNLVDFAKTEDIAPGENEVVTLKASARDFASYDCYDLNHNNEKTYEIDSGTYELKLMSNSHDVLKVDMLTGGNNVDGVFRYSVSSDIILDKDPVTGKKIKNLFTGEDAVDGVSIDGLNDKGGNQAINYISRKDFASLTTPVAKSSTHDISTGRKMSQSIKDRILFAGANRNDNTKAIAWDNATVDEFGNQINNSNVTFGASKQDSLQIAKNGVPTELGLELGADYNHQSWDAVLDQVTLDEAKNMINRAHANVSAINSIGYPGQFDQDGPCQIGGFGNRNIRGVGYPDSTVLAQTWNKTLAYEFGLSYGADMVSHGVDGTYGVAINIHRSPFGGRNYEYYSEDPKLTGYMAAEAVKGITDMGRNTFVKHFAAAQTETGRDSLYTWMSEQAFREIYLECFRIVVEEGKTTAIMTAYNRVGALWAGGSTALLTGVLRGEWGFNGTIITDYSDNNQYMNLDETLRAGGDLGMAVGLAYGIDGSNRIKQRAKDAVKHTVYAWLNSKYRAEEYKKHPYKGKEVISANTQASWNWIRPVVIDVNILLGAVIFGLLAFGVFDVTSLFFKKEKTE